MHTPHQHRSPSLHRCVAAFALVGALCVVTPTHAAVLNVTPSDDWVAILKNLQAGDTLVLAAGTYMTGGKVDLDLQGTETAPITVMGDPTGERPLIIGVSNQNTFDLGGAWYHFEYLEITGGSHGVRIETSTHGTFRDLVMHDLGDVGFSMNRSGHSYDNMHITECEIYDTGKAPMAVGEGMYIGCNDGSCVVSSSRFDFNYVHDIGGSQGDGIEIKKNSWGNVVADNVVVNTYYPGITMYGYDAVEMPRNVVERNLVWQTWDNGIQVNGQVIVRNNVIVGAATNGANGIHSKPTSPHLPHDVDIIHNTVIDAGGVCLRTNTWDQADNQVVANNALYCPNSQGVKVVGNSATMTWSNNAVLGGVEGNSVVQDGTVLAPGTAATDFEGTSIVDVYPTSTSGLVNAGDATWSPAVDFNQTPRDDGTPDIGAFEWTDQGNPQPTPSDTFKTPPAAPADPGPEVSPETPPETVEAAEPLPEPSPEVGPEPAPEVPPEVATDAQPQDASAETGSDSSGSDSGVDANTQGDNTHADAGPDDLGSTTPPPADDGCTGGRPWHRGLAWMLAALALVMLARRNRRDDRAQPLP